MPSNQLTNSTPKHTIRTFTKLAVIFLVSIFVIILSACLYYFQLHKSPTTNLSNNFNQTDIRTLQQQGIFADQVYVKKSTRTMQLIHNHTVIRQYHIALGDNPQGQKQQEGDERTPEGWYTLDWANEKSKAYRSLHISYPNSVDIAKAKSMGVTAGGAIMIHGQMNGLEKLTPLMQQRDWTNGCIAVTNAEMDEIMALVKVGTPIFIEW